MWIFANLRVLPPFRSKTWSLNTFTQQSLTSQYKIATEVDCFITEGSLCVDAAAWEWLNLCHSWDSPRAEFGLVAGGQALGGWTGPPLEAHIHMSAFYPIHVLGLSYQEPAPPPSPFPWFGRLVFHIRVSISDCRVCEHRALLGRRELLPVLLFFFFFPSLENFIQIPIFAPDLLRQIYWLSFSVLKQ